MLSSVNGTSAPILRDYQERAIEEIFSSVQLAPEEEQ